MQEDLARARERDIGGAELDAERATESFAKKKEAAARRRDKAQAEYVEDFFGAVVTFLAFHPTHADSPTGWPYSRAGGRTSER